MAQIASVLAVTTVFFISLQIQQISRQRREAYMQDENTYAGIWAKMAEGGDNCGILW